MAQMSTVPTSALKYLLLCAYGFIVITYTKKAKSLKLGLQMDPHYIQAVVGSGSVTTPHPQPKEIFLWVEFQTVLWREKWPDVE